MAATLPLLGPQARPAGRATSDVPRKPPQQVNLFTGAADVWPEQLELELPPVDLAVLEEPGISQSDDGSQLYVAGFGLMLGKKSERLVVKKQGRILHQVPFFRLQHVTVGSRGVSFSSDLLEELCERGVRLAVLGSTGHPIALIASPMLTATVETRRQQLLAFLDQRGVEAARRMVIGKLGNQEKLLRYYAKHARESETKEGRSQPSEVSNENAQQLGTLNYPGPCRRDRRDGGPDRRRTAARCLGPGAQHR